MTTFIEEVDDILNNHAQEFKAGHMDTVRDSLLNLVSERIIGEDTGTIHPRGVLKSMNVAQNGLREQQRTTLYEGTKNGDNDK